jgi:hypothetical protein
MATHHGAADGSHEARCATGCAGRQRETDGDPTRRLTRRMLRPFILAKSSTASMGGLPRVATLHARPCRSCVKGCGSQRRPSSTSFPTVMTTNRDSSANRYLTDRIRKRCQDNMLRVMRVRWTPMKANSIDVEAQRDLPHGRFQPLATVSVTLDSALNLGPPMSCLDENVLNAIAEAFPCNTLAGLPPSSSP